MGMEKKRLQAEHHAGEDDEVEDDCMSRDVQSLVAQQMSEIEAIERHWHTEIDHLKLRQKESYCDLIVDFFEQEMDQESSIAEGAGVCDSSGSKGCQEGTGIQSCFSESVGMENLASPFLP